MRAERQRREAILTAKGEKQSAILTAEGQKQAAILQAEAEKEKAIQEAEGRARAELFQAEAKAKAILMVAEATAQAEQLINDALKTSAPTKEVIALRALEAVKESAEGQATKIVLPSELTGIGVLASAVKDSAGSPPKTVGSQRNVSPLASFIRDRGYRVLPGSFWLPAG